MKMNVDGNSKGNPGLASVGELLRNDQGRWLLGFLGKLKDSTSLQAELWAILQDLRIIQSKNLKKVIMETDSLKTLNLITARLEDVHPQRNIIANCKYIMGLTNTLILHTLREENFCTDKMANVTIGLSSISAPTSFGCLVISAHLVPRCRLQRLEVVVSGYALQCQPRSLKNFPVSN